MGCIVGSLTSKNDNFTECLLCAKHWSRRFPRSLSSGPLNSSAGWAPSPPLTDEGSAAQRSEVACCMSPSWGTSTTPASTARSSSPSPTFHWSRGPFLKCRRGGIILSLKAFGGSSRAAGKDPNPFHNLQGPFHSPAALFPLTTHSDHRRLFVAP